MRTLTWLTGLLVLSLLATPALADHHEEMGGEEMSEEEAAMMEQWMEAATPNENHEALEFMIGEFESTMRFRMSPDEDWKESPSSAMNVWMLDGRFVHMHATAEPSEMMPMPFEGAGMFGYNNMDDEYQAIWMDNYGTMMVMATGHMEDGVLILTGSYNHPWFGEDWPIHWEYEESDNGYVMRFYEPTEDGGEFLHGEIVNERV